MFHEMNGLVIAVFSLSGLFFLFIIGRGLAEWARNNSQPVLEVDAHVLQKRNEVVQRERLSDGNSRSFHSSNFYYVTFEVYDGNRFEFPVSGGEYGLLREGDQGRLCYQGTRYHHFKRVA